jgi:hypothetical protein
MKKASRNFGKLRERNSENSAWGGRRLLDWGRASRIIFLLSRLFLFDCACQEKTRGKQHKKKEKNKSKFNEEKKKENFFL